MQKRYRGLMLLCQLVSVIILSTTIKVDQVINYTVTAQNNVSTNVKPTLQIPNNTLITRRSPKLNGDGKVEGSIRILSGESFDINGNSTVAGDIYVPGSPEINKSSGASYKGTVIGDGKDYPSNYVIKLNGSSTINHIITRTDAVTINQIPFVTEPKGTRDVFLIKGDSPGDFSTIRDLVLTRRYNLALAVPEGSYGILRAHGKSAFILGVDNKETIYNLHSLELNSNTLVEIRGKVTINIQNSLTLNSNSKIGDAKKIADLTVNIKNGEVKLNSNTRLYGTVNIPEGVLTLNSNSRLVGQVICDSANFNSNSLLTYIPNNN
ncbi:MAG: hypothetical protein JNM06_10105 [Blastocatellia bacterium]|nr:hypothetical protein [Blastocatellia bacterium]